MARPRSGTISTERHRPAIRAERRAEIRDLRRFYPSKHVLNARSRTAWSCRWNRSRIQAAGPAPRHCPRRRQLRYVRHRVPDHSGEPASHTSGPACSSRRTKSQQKVLSGRRFPQPSQSGGGASSGRVWIPSRTARARTSASWMRGVAPRRIGAAYPLSCRHRLGIPRKTRSAEPGVTSYGLCCNSSFCRMSAATQHAPRRADERRADCPGRHRRSGSMATGQRPSGNRFESSSHAGRDVTGRTGTGRSAVGMKNTVRRDRYPPFRAHA